jgi:hypothetical protein
MPVETPRFTRALEAELRERASRPQRRRLPSLRPALAVVAILAALAFAVLPGSDDPGEQASPPPKPYTVTMDELLSGDRATYDRLQREFEARGEKLIVRERRVAPDAEVLRGGRPAVSLEIPAPRRDDGRAPVVVEKLEGPIVVTVPVPDPDEKLEGRSICQTIPALNDLMDGDDPQGSIRRMREAGFDVTVRRVPWDKPGDKDIIIQVTGPGGKLHGVPPDTKKLTVEIGSPGEGHTTSGSC